MTENHLNGRETLSGGSCGKTECALKERLIRILSEVPAVSDWRVTETKKHSVQLFYVLKQLETTRVSDSAETEVTVYVDRDGMRGEASAICYEHDSEETLYRKITEAVSYASYAVNPFYEIPSPKDCCIPESSSDLKGADLPKKMEELVNAVFSADVPENGYLSATEFFLNESTVRIQNSKGVDLTQVFYSGNVELIPSYKTEQDDVETYHWISFETLDPEKVKKETEENLLLAKARLSAVKPDLKGTVKVILEEEDVASIFRYYADELNYQGKVDHSNRYEIGDCLQGKELMGDTLDLKLVPYYPGAVASRFFDGNGVVLSEVELIRGGIALARHGTYRAGYYLGVKEPTGSLPVVVVREGTKSFSEMKKEPYLHIVRFSDMQVDPDSGFFGGEVRLGFYFDGEKEIPVTGISVSGNLLELGGKMRYSSECTTTGGYHGPKYLEVSMEVFG